jgi:hypothetical protein
MRSRVDWLATEGGHIVVALFGFVVGVGMVLWKGELGKEVVGGARASLWTAIRTGARAQDKGE